MIMKNYLKLMRVKHYLKNFLIFLPLVFSGLLFKNDNLIKVILGFLSFSFASSVVYIINDIRDKKKDMLHEIKKNRPIASGKIGVLSAIIFALFLFILSILMHYLIDKTFNISYIFIIIYVFINILYSFGLKDIPILDIAILVSGFFIRVLYGANIVQTEISNWLYLTIISISFYLGLGKRRNEIKKSDSKTRKVLEYYNKDFLDKNMYMCLSLAIVFYSLWCVDPIVASRTSPYLIWTIPIVILLCMKYSMDIESDSHGDPVDVIIADKFLIIFGLLYAIILFFMVY